MFQKFMVKKKYLVLVAPSFGIILMKIQVQTNKNLQILLIEGSVQYVELLIQVIFKAAKLCRVTF